MAYRGLAASMAAVCALGLIVVGGCGKSDDLSGFGDKEAGADGSNLDADNPDVSFLGDTGGDGGISYGCSPDLRDVIDGNGVVVKTCDPDQGCSGGQCVPACKAA